MGGSKYNAYILTNERPNARIFLNGAQIGKGNAVIKKSRKEADKLVFKVVEEGCEEQIFAYRSRTFRGWAFLFTLLGWTGVIDGIPVPWGLALDLATGSLWKPNLNEPGVSKVNYKNYRYKLTYIGCPSGTKDQWPTGFIKNGSIIKGTIVEEQPNVSLKLKTSDGSIFVFKVEEIEKIIRLEE